MKLPSIPFVADAFFGAVRRFPLTMVSVFVGVVFMMLLIEHNYQEDETYLIKIILPAALGVSLFMSAAVITEKWRLSGFYKWIPSVFAAILLVIYYLTLGGKEEVDNVNTAIRFNGFLIAAHLLVAFVPYLDKTPVEDFWTYNKLLFGNFLVGAFYSMLIYAGLSLAILAIDNLFNLHIDDKIYGHLFVIIAGVFNTAYFLANFPKEFSGIASNDKAFIPAFLPLTKFVFIPIVAIYFLILYAYSAKILFEWDLPKGWVSSLVLGFSIAGGFTYLLNYYLVNIDDNSALKKYRKYFFLVLLPMVVLLFVAIGRRLLDYGVTEARFTVATAGVWLFLVCVYFIISRKDNIKFIPISLFLFTFFSILGPFNMFRVSQGNQTSRLEALLVKNNLLENGIAIPAVDTISNEDGNDIKSVLYYLGKHNYLENIPGWFEVEGIEDKNRSYDIIDYFNLDEKIHDASPRYCNIFFALPLDMKIDGYERMIMPAYSTWPEKSFEGWDLRINEENELFELSLDSSILDEIKIMPYMEMLAQKYKCTETEFDKEDAVFTLRGEQYELKLVTKSIGFAKGEKLELRNWEGTCMIRKTE